MQLNKVDEGIDCRGAVEWTVPLSDVVVLRSVNC